MLSPQKASEIAGVSRKTIMNHISGQTLGARRNNKGHWVIDPEDLEQWMENRRETASQWHASGISMASHAPQNDVVSPEFSGTTNNTELTYAAAYEVKKAEADMLRGRVAQLEQEVSEARQDAREARQSFNNLSSKLVDMITAQPLLLTPKYRVK